MHTVKLFFLYTLLRESIQVETTIQVESREQDLKTITWCPTGDRSRSSGCSQYTNRTCPKSSSSSHPHKLTTILHFPTGVKAKRKQPRSDPACPSFPLLVTFVNPVRTTALTAPFTCTSHPLSILSSCKPAPLSGLSSFVSPVHCPFPPSFVSSMWSSE